jgi:hypothetical protein
MLLQRPLHSSIELADAAVSAAAADVTALEQQAARYEQYRGEAAVTRAALRQLARMIPQRESVPGLLVTLEQMAQRDGVSLAGVRVAEASASGPLLIQRLELRLTGRFADLRTLLARLERLATPAEPGYHVRGRLLEVTALTLAADQASTEATSAPPAPLDAKVLLQAYSWRGQQPQAPAAAE